MARTIKRTALTATVILTIVVTTFAVLTDNTFAAESSELDALDMTTDFLSNVAGVDMTKYALAPPPAGWEKLNITGNNIKTVSELVSVDFYGTGFLFNSTEGTTLDIMSIFRFGHLAAVKVESFDDVIFSESPSTDLLNQTKSILKRYEAFFVKAYDRDNSFLLPMQNILNNLNSLAPMNMTVDNMNFLVSKDGDRTRVQWIYTENGVSMGNWKRVEVEFRKNSFESFSDSWSLYKVNGLSKISSEEAKQIALEAAQNCEFRIVNDNVNEVVTLPDLSDAVYDMYFTMLPYRYEASHIQSKMSRDPLTLYPYWQFYFYFKGGKIGGYSGIQVGVWGDTSEIIYCSGFGYLGDSGVPNGELPSNQTVEENTNGESPNNEALEQQQTQTQPDFRVDLILAVVVSLVVILTVSLIYFKKRKREAKPS